MARVQRQQTRTRGIGNVVRVVERGHEVAEYRVGPDGVPGVAGEVVVEDRGEDADGGCLEDGCPHCGGGHGWVFERCFASAGLAGVYNMELRYGKGILFVVFYCEGCGIVVWWRQVFL